MTDHQEAPNAADAATADPLDQFEGVLREVEETPLVRSPFSLQPEVVAHLADGLRAQASVIRDLRDRLAALEGTQASDEEG